ncbi:MAG TPA: hypothetical protein VG816_03330 [Solirubrobacterales bacterium]|nr:hypothetical protein [Solirubrobacterales bacterium]
MQQSSWEPTRRVRGQDAEEGAACRHPRQGLLQHPNEQVALTQLGHGQGSQRPIHSEVSAEQDAVDAEASGQ